MRRLVQEPCLLRGRRAGLLPILLPSPPIVSHLSAFISSADYLLRASLAPSHRTSVPIFRSLHQPPCCPSLPLSPLRRWCCKSTIAIPQHNLDINTSALDDFCPSLLRGGCVRSWLVGILSPPTILHCRGVVRGCRSPFVVSLVVPPLLLCGLPLHSLPSIVFRRGSGGGGVR
jgi:hypothetical protein